MQIYVGAFQQLLQKQKKSEKIRNESNKKSSELKSLMVIARNTLCEIETAINHTGRIMPVVFSRQTMDSKLTFRNNNSGPTSDEVDDLDIKFAKVRFGEYVHSQKAVIERPRKRFRKNDKNNNNVTLKSGEGKKNKGRRQNRKFLKKRGRKNLRKSTRQILI